MEKAGIYIHIPYCLRKCYYCSFCSSARMSTQDAYLERLKEEIERFKGSKDVDTVYIGGGTPSVVRRGFLSQVETALKNKFLFTELSEFTVECNPESTSYGFLMEAKHIGVNRLSLGLQSASDIVLKKSGRGHTVADFVEAVRRAKSLGIQEISADIILGLPGQDTDDIKKAIELFDKCGVDHASAYLLTVEKDTKLHKNGYKVEDDVLADMFESALVQLAKYGYERYEVSNFARNGKVAKHNKKYWTGANYYGFGLSAHSLINGVRKENTSDLQRYLSGKTLKKTVRLNTSAKKMEKIMLSLRTVEGLNLMEYRREFDEDILVTKKAQINKLTSLGLVQKKDDYLVATDKGMMLLNSVIVELT